jgi:NAD(P)-dependent dehydrogenase (short-subunit alcohol dehydrogenase family)
LIVDLQLRSKIALVTGSTAGIGFAIGSGLPGEGATVINGRSKKHVDQAIKTIRQRHPQANLEACAGDLSTTDTVQRVLSWRAQHALTAWKNSWVKSLTPEASVRFPPQPTERRCV